MSFTTRSPFLEPDPSRPRSNSLRYQRVRRGGDPFAPVSITSPIKYSHNRRPNDLNLFPTDFSRPVMGSGLTPASPNDFRRPILRGNRAGVVSPTHVTSPLLGRRAVLESRSQNASPVCSHRTLMNPTPMTPNLYSSRPISPIARPMSPLRTNYGVVNMAFDPEDAPSSPELHIEPEDVKFLVVQHDKQTPNCVCLGWILLSFCIAFLQTYSLSSHTWFIVSKRAGEGQSFGLYGQCNWTTSLGMNGERTPTSACRTFFAKNLLLSIPSSAWQASFLLSCAACSMLWLGCFLAGVSVYKTTFKKTTTSWYAGYLQLVGVIIEATSVLVFPVGLGSSFALHVCGQEAGIYNRGSCYPGWALVTAVSSILLGLSLPYLAVKSTSKKTIIKHKQFDAPSSPRENRAFLYD